MILRSVVRDGQPYYSRNDVLNKIYYWATFYVLFVCIIIIYLNI